MWFWEKSYAQLGLMATPNPRLSGGLEPLPIIPFAHQSHYYQPVASTSSLKEQPKLGPNGKIPKGYARVERDAAGKIINVILADEDEVEEDMASSSTPWGEPLLNVEMGNHIESVDLPEDYGLNRTQGIPMPIEVDGIVKRVRVPEKHATTVVTGSINHDHCSQTLLIVVCSVW